MPFLNVVYGQLPFEIRTDEMEVISELRRAIKADFGDLIPAPPAAIQLYKPHSDEQIATMADLRALPEEYYKKIEKGGLALEIRTLTPPTIQPSRQNVQPYRAPAISGLMIPSMAYAAVRNEYLARAECLKDDPATKELVQLIEDVIETNEEEIIFYGLSSGMGKTQMAHNLMKCYEGKRKVVYLLGQRFNGTTQSIYNFYNKITELFHDCVEADLQNLRDDQLDPEALRIRPLYVFGFMRKLLDDGAPQGMWLIVPEMADKVAQRWINNKYNKPVIIIDEYNTAGDKSPTQLQFIRNCFSAVGLNPLLMGANTSATDIVEQSTISRGKSQKWARIFTKATKVTEQSCGFDSLNYQLDGEFGLIKDMILNSRPLFAVEAVDYLLRHGPSGGFVPYLDNMLDYLHDKFVDWIEIGSTADSQRGQLMLTLNCSYALADLAQESSLIDRHYANLYTEIDVLELAPFRGYLVYKNLQDETMAWVPVALFPTPDEDLLLHLTMIGTKNRSGIFVDIMDEIERRPYMNLMNEVQLSAKVKEKCIKLKNIQQKSNDGNFLEACMVSTIIHSSHMNGVAGIGFQEFLPQLAYELYSGNDATAGPGQLTGQPLTACNERIIPFLLAPNQELDGDFMKACNQSGVLLATCKRTLMADRTDFSSDDKVFSGEAKDCSGCADPAAMKTILERVPKDYSIHIVLTKGLQKSCFTENDFREYASNLDNLEPVPAFFLMEPVFDSENMVVNAELNWIKGLPHDGTSDRIVLFVIVPERRGVVVA
ncbi:hypothetical protein MP638_007449 [Amoeboaphelidium occidentale]|nr:hypothetical protein MP638_007449 [Amoeboaphelidium occidentale]